MVFANTSTAMVQKINKHVPIYFSNKFFILFFQGEIFFVPNKKQTRK